MNKNNQNIASIYGAKRTSPASNNKAKGFADYSSLLQTAIEDDIPVYKNTELMNMLSKLDNIRAIPDEYYPAVAETLAYLYKLEQESKKVYKEN